MEPTPEDYFVKGGYEAAIEAGEAQGDAAGYALAARAALAEATLRDRPCLECLHHARDLARHAIMEDADYAEGHIEFAAALGYEARLIGSFRARFGRFAEQAKDAIDTALRLTPDDPWALSAAGGWNIEVVRTGGSLLGRLLYGATFEKGVDLYRRALAADPGNQVISLQYALALTSYDFEGKRLEIMAVLDATAREDPRDAYSGVMKARAAELLDLLMRDKRDDYRALARRYLGFP